MLMVVNAFDSSQSKQCLAQKGLRKQCKWHDECLSNYCLKRKCSKLPKKGEPCGSQFRCGRGLGCSSLGLVCVAEPKEGEKCIMNSESQFYCGQNLLCYKGVCQKPNQDENSICSDNLQCSENFRCTKNNQEHICKPQKGRFRRCEKDLDCKNDLYCHSYLRGMFKLCRYRKRKGKKCSAEGHCRNGLSCIDHPTRFSWFSWKTCKNLPGRNEYCAGKCTSGLYCA